MVAARLKSHSYPFMKKELTYEVITKTDFDLVSIERGSISNYQDQLFF